MTLGGESKSGMVDRGEGWRLGTTRDERLWRRDGNLVLLGVWCKPDAATTLGSNESMRIAPYPFDDREQLYQAYRYLDRLYHSVVGKLGRALDKFHGEEHTVRYWKAVLGYWLREFMEIVYERDVCLTEAVKRYPQVETAVPRRENDVVPNDSLHFAQSYKEDRFNAHLYGEIIRARRLIPYTEVPLDAVKRPTPPLRARLAAAARRRATLLLLRLAAGNRLFFTSTYFPLRDLLRLSVMTRSFLLLRTSRVPVEASTRPVSPDRQVLADIRAEDDFEKLVYRLLPAFLPKTYWEDYGSVGQFARRLLPRRPRIVVTANGFAYDDLFGRWVAEKIEAGTAYVILQHGGSYGCARWNSSEDYEVDVADRFYTFGWDDSRERVRPLAGSRLRLRRQRRGVNRTGYILWAVVSFPRYAYTMYSVPSGPHTLAYLDDQSRFLESVSSDVRRLLRYRGYPIDYGWRDFSRLTAGGATVRRASGRRNMIPLFKGARLFVGTFNATAFLEAFILNVPTVLFWNPTLWEERPAATSFFGELRAAKVLHATPESAAAFVNQIWAEPHTWWDRAEVRDAVARFRDRFARGPEVSIVDWQREIESALLARQGRYGQEAASSRLSQAGAASGPSHHG